jgi:hypothetical protein
VTYYGWQAIVVSLVLLAMGAGYVAVALIGFNRWRGKQGFPPLEF